MMYQSKEDTMSQEDNMYDIGETIDIDLGDDAKQKDTSGKPSNLFAYLRSVITHTASRPQVTGMNQSLSVFIPVEVLNKCEIEVANFLILSKKISDTDHLHVKVDIDERTTPHPGLELIYQVSATTDYDELVTMVTEAEEDSPLGK